MCDFLEQIIESGKRLENNLDAKFLEALRKATMVTLEETEKRFDWRYTLLHASCAPYAPGSEEWIIWNIVLQPHRSVHEEHKDSPCVIVWSFLIHAPTKVSVLCCGALFTVSWDFCEGSLLLWSPEGNLEEIWMPSTLADKRPVTMTEQLPCTSTYRDLVFSHTTSLPTVLQKIILSYLYETTVECEIDGEICKAIVKEGQTKTPLDSFLGIFNANEYFLELFSLRLNECN